MRRYTLYQRSSSLPADLDPLLDAALKRRAALLSSPATDAVRLFHGAADGIDGLVIEQIGPALVAQLHEGRLRVAEDRLRRLCARAMELRGCRAVYRKHFVGDRGGAAAALERVHRDPAPWIGTAVEAEYAVHENGVRYLVRPYDGFSFGLFLEQRDNRRRVRERCGGLRLLNCFAYTCGFSVAAALGGAAETVSVDASKRFLEWGKRNFAANGMPLDGQRFIWSDVLEYFRRAQRQGRTFDAVILDPPTFGRSKPSGRTFVVDRDLDPLVGGAVRLLRPGGWMLLATNHRGTSRMRLERTIERHAGTRGVRSIERPALPADFPGDAEYAKSVWAQLG